jgi:uncharacterized protein YndB with AHSA1/START domain
VDSIVQTNTPAQVPGRFVMDPAGQLAMDAESLLIPYVRPLGFERSSQLEVWSMPSNTIRLHRVLRSKPERVYRAFLDPDAICKWLPPNGFTGKVHHMDARVGGTYRTSFTNFSSGASHAFGGTFLELVPNERISYTDTFDDPNLPGVMKTTVSLKAVSCGTELDVVQEGVPEMIPPEMCYLGWQESLDQLMKLVEPEIPG